MSRFLQSEDGGLRKVAVVDFAWLGVSALIRSQCSELLTPVPVVQGFRQRIVVVWPSGNSTAEIRELLYIDAVEPEMGNRFHLQITGS